SSHRRRKYLVLMAHHGARHRARMSEPATPAYDGGMPRLARILGLGLVIAALLFLPGWAAAGPVAAQPEEWGQTDLVLFWGDGCPHCAAEKEWLEQAREDYPDLEVHEYEVWYDEANRALLIEVADEM